MVRWLQIARRLTNELFSVMIIFGVDGQKFWLLRFDERGWIALLCVHDENQLLFLAKGVCSS